MIKVNETEFYTKNENKPSETEEDCRTAIQGFVLPSEPVFCKDCEFYKESYYDWGNFDIPESCKHPENTIYTYDHKGRHSHEAWEPSGKNETLRCELYQKKKSIMKKIMVKIGVL